MIDKYKISFIVTLYNNEKYILKCIDSILNQNLKNYEIIIIDDGSTDNGYNVCLNKYKNNDHIRLFTRKNGGVSSTRNFGIEVSTGEKIMFVDSDDYLEANSLKNIDNFDYDLIFFGFNKEYVKNKINCIDKKLEINNKSDALFNIHRNRNVAGYLPMKVFSREIIINNKLRFDSKIAFCEDLLFVDEYVRCSNSFKYYPCTIYNYIQRRGSVSFEKYNDKHLTIFKAFLMIIERFDNDNSNSIVINTKFDYIMKSLFMRSVVTSDIKNNSLKYIKIEKILNKISCKDKLLYFIVKYTPFIYYGIRKIKHNKYGFYE